MNEDKMLQVLARIEDSMEAYNLGEDDAIGFDMGFWYTQASEVAGCGTTACLAGHAVLMEGYRIDITCLIYQKDSPFVSNTHVATQAARILGLKNSEARILFHLPGLYAVYETVAEWMGIDVTVLEDKVDSMRCRA